MVCSRSNTLYFSSPFNQAFSVYKHSETSAARYGYPPPQHPPPHYGYGAPPGGLALTYAFGKGMESRYVPMGSNKHIEALGGSTYQDIESEHSLLKSYHCVFEKIHPAFLESTCWTSSNKPTASQTAGHPPPPGYGYGPCAP